MAIQPRKLSAVESPGLLARMLPYPELREKVEIAAGIPRDRAKVMRGTSAHGTNGTCKRNIYPTVPEFACTGARGRWDHRLLGSAFTGSDDEGLDATMPVTRARSARCPG